MTWKKFIFCGLLLTALAGCASYDFKQDLGYSRVRIVSSELLGPSFKAPAVWPFEGKTTFTQRITFKKNGLGSSFFFQAVVSPESISGVVFMEGVSAPLYRFEWTPRTFEGAGFSKFTDKMDPQIFFVDFLTSMMPLEWLKTSGLAITVWEKDYPRGTRRFVDLGPVLGIRQILYLSPIGGTKAFELVNPDLEYTLSIQTVEG